MFEGVVWEKKGEGESSEMDEWWWGGVLVEYFVEGIDWWFEGGVRADKWKQLRVFVMVRADATVEEDVATHLSYIINNETLIKSHWKIYLSLSTSALYLVLKCKRRGSRFWFDFV